MLPRSEAGQTNTRNPGFLSAVTFILHLLAQHAGVDSPTEKPPLYRGGGLAQTGKGLIQDHAESYALTLALCSQGYLSTPAVHTRSHPARGQELCPPADLSRSLHPGGMGSGWGGWLVS